MQGFSLPGFKASKKNNMHLDDPNQIAREGQNSSEKELEDIFLGRRETEKN